MDEPDEITGEGYAPMVDGDPEDPLSQGDFAEFAEAVADVTKRVSDRFKLIDDELDHLATMLTVFLLVQVLFDIVMLIVFIVRVT